LTYDRLLYRANPRGSLLVRSLPALLLSTGPLLYLFSVALPPALIGAGEKELPFGRLAGLFFKSFGISLLATLIAIVLGTAFALWLIMQKGIVRKAGWFLLFLPLLLPRYVLGLTWWSIFDSSGFLGGLLSSAGVAQSTLSFFAVPVVIAFAWYPVVAVIVLLDLEMLSSGILEGASVQGDSSRTWIRGILPGLKTPLISSGAFIFCVSMTGYAVPALFQVPVYSTELYSEFSFSGDASMVTLYALPLFILGIICAPLLAGGLALSPGGRFAGRSPSSRIPGYPGLFKLFLYPPVIAALAVPVATPFLLACKTGSVRVFMESAGESMPEISYSIGVALMAAAIAVLCAVPVATGLLKHKSRILLALCLLPAMVPAPFYALGLAYSGIPVGGAFALACAHAGRFLPFALLALLLVLRRLDPRPVDALRMLPERFLVRKMKLRLHFLLPAFAAAGAVVIALSLGDIGVSILLAPPGARIFSVKLFNLLHYGAGDRAAALALSLIPLVYLVWAGGALTAGRIVAHD